jgi:hypothetical protein
VISFAHPEKCCRAHEIILEVDVCQGTYYMSTLVHSRPRARGECSVLDAYLLHKASPEIRLVAQAIQKVIPLTIREKKRHAIAN